MKTFDLIRFRLHDPCVLALGFFECVHLGHKKVIFRATALARKLGVKSAVFLFKNNSVFIIFEDACGTAQILTSDPYAENPIA